MHNIRRVAVMKRIVVGMVMVSLMVAGMVLSCEARAGRGMMKGDGGGFYIMECLENLNLTDAQKKEIVAILDGHKAERKSLRNRFIEARENLQKVMLRDDVTDGDVREAWRRVASVREDMLLMRAKIHRDIAKILTPRQKELIKQMAERRRNMVKRRFEERERVIMGWLRGEI